MNKDSLELSSLETFSLEDRLAEREQTLLEQQQRLDELQQRQDETFRDLVEVTRLLHQTQRSKEGLQGELQEGTQALREAETRVGTLVRQLEERERAMLEEERERAMLEEERERAMLEKERERAVREEERERAVREEERERAVLEKERERAVLEEERERAMLQEERERAMREEERHRYRRENEALESVLQRQSQDLGRLVGLLERHQAEREREVELASRKKGVGHMLWLPFVRLSDGMFKGRKQRQRLKKEVTMIAGSPWFDREWYLSAYPDVAGDEKMSQTPARHYLLIGGFEGRNPGPDFDSSFYISNNHDVRESGVNPLLHFIKFGEHEQRQPKAVD